MSSVSHAGPTCDPSPKDAIRFRASLASRLTNLGAVVLPFVALVVAVVLLWGWGVHWEHLSVMGVLYLLSGLGVTVGFHRLFTHRSFATVRPVQWILAVLGSMAVQGPLFRWVAQHRLHHQKSDQEGDPHSPHLHGRTWKGALRGFWHAHTGWLFEGYDVDLPKYVGDLAKERGLRIISKLFVVWVILGLLLPAGLGWLLTSSWKGALLGLLWGGLVRIFFLHHVTWSINSVCHLWGSRPFRANDESRNNVVFGVLAMGEGWHNNHHAFPTSARHGLRWWEVDGSYAVIRGLEVVGLAWNVRRPDGEVMERKRAAR